MFYFTTKKIFFKLDTKKKIDKITSKTNLLLLIVLASFRTSGGRYGAEPVVFYTMKEEYKNEDSIEGVEKEPEEENKEEVEFEAWDTSEDDGIVPETTEGLISYEDQEEKLSRFSPEY